MSERESKRINEKRKKMTEEGKRARERERK